MSVLVVMAHFDVGRTLRKHTAAAIRNYSECAARVVIVSTSGISKADLESLPANVDFVTRGNYGYDFFSYKWALDIVGDYAAYDRLVIVNDTFVGPVVSLNEILHSEQASKSDLLGMTWSSSHGGHVQSFFVTVSSAVSRSNGFQRFWRDMSPISDRKSVIMRYEVGLTRAVTDAGFTAGGYLEPTAEEESLAQERRRHYDDVRVIPRSAGKTVRETGPSTSQSLRAYNPAVALADRMLTDLRLPLLKFDTLRYDPYGLGAMRLLREAEQSLPTHMDGVREFLRTTRPNYAFRPHEHNRLADPIALARSGVGYCTDSAFMRDTIRGEQET
ncbi:rhamnan synthesis F family protein [Microbacterium sp.]